MQTGPASNSEIVSFHSMPCVVDDVANFFEAPFCVATLCRHTKTLTFPRFIFQPSETLEAELYEVLIYGYGQAKLKSRAGQTQAIGPMIFSTRKIYHAKDV